jgi:hypothetical protein
VQVNEGREPLPVPVSLAATVSRVLTAMPAPARSLVEAASVLAAQAPLLLVAQVANVTDSATALEPALTAGLLRWWPGEASTPVAVSHPLQRRHRPVI